jgi:hypothetical protein
LRDRDFNGRFLGLAGRKNPYISPRAPATDFFSIGYESRAVAAFRKTLKNTVNTR